VCPQRPTAGSQDDINAPLGERTNRLPALDYADHVLQGFRPTQLRPCAPGRYWQP
jgi:hypothetical protein